MRITKQHTALLFNIEFLYLILVILSLVYSIVIIYQPNPSYVHQFETFEQLVDATISCAGHKNLTNFAEQTRSIRNKTSGDKIDILDELSVDQFLNNTQNQPLPSCPIDKDRLRYFNDYELNTWLNYRHIQFGGQFKPIGCKPLQKVAIIIPYRDRSEQLAKFSLYIHQFLPDQLIDYTIYVVEQKDNQPFNRAKLFNVGVEEISKVDPEICCFIFHDVDLLPLDQRNLYMCSTKPRHLSPGVSTLRFTLLYPNMFGGVISMTKNQFDTIGGFSNAFFGWGGEDDDIFRRVRAAGYDIERSPKEYGVYIMLKHSKMEPNPLRFQLLQANSGQVVSDANTISAREDSRTRLTYELQALVKKQLYTLISVKL